MGRLKCIIKICSNKVFLRAIIIYVLIYIIAVHTFSPNLGLPSAENGLLVLNENVLKKNKAIPLNGQWEFYWEKLLHKNDLKEESFDLYANVPSAWNTYTMDGSRLSGQGYGTYILHVKTDLHENTILGLKTSAQSSAYRIFINDKLIASNGTVSGTSAGEIGDYRPQLVFFNTPAEEFDITVQISNHRHSKGGFWNRILIGTADNITQYYNTKLIFEFLAIGSMLLITVFSLARYFRRRDVKTYLYFGLFCIAAMFLVDFLNEMVIISQLKISFRLLLFIWYTVSSLIVLLFIAHYWYAMRTKPLFILMKAYLIVFLFYELLFFFTEASFYTMLANVYNFIDMIFVLAVITMVIAEAIKGFNNGELHIISSLLLFEAYFNGAVNYNNYGINYSTLGLILFCIIHALFLADQAIKNDEEKRAAELLFLRAQINPHFLFNTLNSFIAISRTNLDKAIELLYNLIDYLRQGFDVKDFSQFVPLEQEISLAKTYLEIEKVRFTDRMDISFYIDADMNVKVPVLMLQPVLENAIKHGIMKKQERGTIQINIRQEDCRLFFHIRDNGVGMSKQRLKEVLTDPHKKRVGISNINQRLNSLYGTELKIRSQMNVGTEIEWFVLIKKVSHLKCLLMRVNSYKSIEKLIPIRGGKSMYFRKLWMVILASVLVLGIFPVSTAAAAAESSPVKTAVFTDITGHWGEEAVRKWAGYGIIKGCDGLLRPDDTITRGEMAVVFDNMMDYQTAAKNTFRDLKQGQFYTDAVLKANAAGIIKGDGVAVRPTDKITREEAAVLMSRAFAVETADGTGAFLDAEAVSGWAKGAVSGMQAKGFISGYQGYFNPKAYVTRAEAVTMIGNIVKAYYTEPGTYSEDIDGVAVIKVSGVTLRNMTVTGNLIIAEGVGQGDVYLDSVTVQGETVVRGGGEDSVHITGNSSITKIRIEKAGGKVRIYIDEGITVREMEVTAGEEIFITGSIDNLEVAASGVTVFAVAAEIKSVSVSGEKSKIVIGEQSVAENIKIENTAADVSIVAETGAVIDTVTAYAKVSVSGTGTVARVNLNEGADGSGISTPMTITSVATGVTDVTGAGDQPIPAGSTAANNEDGTDLAEPASGSESSDGGSSVRRPSLAIAAVTVNGEEIPYNAESNLYMIPAGANKDNTAIDVTITNTRNVNYSVSISISDSTGNEVAHADAAGISRTYIDLLSIYGGVAFDDLARMFDNLGDPDLRSGWYLDAAGNTQSGNSETAFRNAIDAMFSRMAEGSTYMIEVALKPVGGRTGTLDFYITKE